MGFNMEKQKQLYFRSIPLKKYLNNERTVTLPYNLVLSSSILLWILLTLTLLINAIIFVIEIPTDISTVAFLISDVEPNNSSQSLTLGMLLPPQNSSTIVIGEPLYFIYNNLEGEGIVTDIVLIVNQEDFRQNFPTVSIPINLGQSRFVVILRIAGFDESRINNDAISSVFNVTIKEYKQSILNFITG
jgi:hypothetical protein